ncbi:MAG TPA: hypothetical protein VI756_22980 [Blastocatellia bacterium]
MVSRVPEKGLIVVLLAATAWTAILPVSSNCMNSQDRKEVPASEAQALVKVQAECDRAVARLHETLDFRSVFNEIWVTDPVLKDRSLRDSYESMRTKARYDPSLVQDVSSGILTAIYLLFLYESNHTERPKELQDRLDDLDASLTRARSEDLSEEVATAELKHLIQVGNRTAEFLRRLLAGESRTELYKRVAEQDAVFAGGHDLPKILHGKASLGLGEDTAIYEVYREGFYWDFVEEGGSYRLVDFRFQLERLW